MTRLFKTAALVTALSPTVALADAIALDGPMKGASLHEAGVDMNVYYTEIMNGAFEVVATYAARETPAETGRLVMALNEGDAVRFGLPGHKNALYSFERKGEIVVVMAEAIERQLASAQ